MNKAEIVHSVSKAKYLGIYLTGLILGVILLIVSVLTLIGACVASNNAEVAYFYSPTPFHFIAFGIISISWLLSLLFFIASNIVLLILFYKLWTAIQDRDARTTPGKAIGFMFIPLFNFYWAFQAIWGCSKDYNKYIRRYSLSIKPLSETRFLIVSIVSVLQILCSPFLGGLLFAPVIHLLIFSFIVNNLCDSINALAQTETRAKISEFKQPTTSSRWHPLPKKYQR